MKQFAVSMVFLRNLSNGAQDIANSVRIVNAPDEDSAFGQAYKSVKEEKYKNYQLSVQVTVEIPDRTNEE